MSWVIGDSRVEEFSELNDFIIIAYRPESGIMI